MILFGLNGDLTCRLECSPSMCHYHELDTDSIHTSFMSLSNQLESFHYLPVGCPSLNAWNGWLFVFGAVQTNQVGPIFLRWEQVSQHTILQSYTSIGKVESANINSRMLQIFLSARPQGYFQIIDGKDLTNYTIPQ